MKRLVLLILAFTLVLAPAYAGQGIAVQPIYLYRSAGPMQFLSATQLASAVGLSAATLASGTVGTAGIPSPPSPLIAEICVETAGIRYTDDGVTTPTASVGIPVVGTSSAPSCFQYAGPLSAFKVILISGSPTMDISYYYAN
jgi:hypothetical protein